MLISYNMWSSNHFSISRFFRVRVQGPGLGPGSESRVQDPGPGSGVRVQGPGPGFRSSHVLSILSNSYNLEVTSELRYKSHVRITLGSCIRLPLGSYVIKSCK